MTLFRFDTVTATFFDVSRNYLGLMQQLKQPHPMGLLYQRQLDNLRLHEEATSHGRPLSDRCLDKMIEQSSTVEHGKKLTSAIPRGPWLV